MARVMIIAYTTYSRDGRVKRHAEALARRGDTVDVLCLHEDYRGELNGVNVIWLPVPRYKGSGNTGYLWSYLRFFAAASVTAACRSARQPYDVIIVCSMPDALVLCALVPRLLRSKVLLDIHDTMPELYRDKFTGVLGALGARMLMFEERASVFLAHRVLAVHDLHATRLREAGIPAEKIRVVINAPDPRLFPRCAGTAGTDGNSPFTLIYHGTIAWRLGVETAIRAVHILRDRVPAVRLKLMGAGNYWGPAQLLAARLGLHDRVCFEQRVPLENLSPVLRQASAGLVPNEPSRATHLMLPAKLLEYATIGLPVIAARLRTIEHFFPEDSVRYFDPGDAASLAEAIEDVYSRPDYRQAMARRAGAIMTGLSWPAQRERLFAAIDSLLPGT